MEGMLTAFRIPHSAFRIPVFSRQPSAVSHQQEVRSSKEGSLEDSLLDSGGGSLSDCEREL
jgi:hypothetical protein